MIVLRTSEETKTHGHAYSLGKAETHPSPLRSPQRAYFFYSERAAQAAIPFADLSMSRGSVWRHVIISTLDSGHGNQTWLYPSFNGCVNSLLIRTSTALSCSCSCRCAATPRCMWSLTLVRLRCERRVVAKVVAHRAHHPLDEGLGRHAQQGKDRRVEEA